MILERLVVAIDADLSGLRNITAGAARMERDVDRHMTRAGASADRFGERMVTVGQRLTLGLTVPIGLLGTASLITAAKMDQLRRGLDSVTGGGRETEIQLRRLREVSKLPGLGFEEAVRGSINLQAAGFSAELAEGALKGFGNALATVGRGRAELDGVIIALGQIASKGKIMAQEINQLAERVPQIRKVMEAAFGTADTEKLQKMGIDATTFVTKVVAELQKLPPVSTGIANSFENITDQSKNTAASWGNRLIPAASGLMDTGSSLLGVLEEMPPALKDISLGAAVAAAAIGPLALAVGGIIRLAPVFVAHWATIAAVGGPVLAAAAALGAVTAAGIAVTNNWKTLRYEGGRLADFLEGRLARAFGTITVSGGPPKAPGSLDTSGVTGDLLASTRFGGAPGRGRWQVPLFTPSTPSGSDVVADGFSAAGFQATARAVEDLIERQKKLNDEAAGLRLDISLAKGKDEADALKAKLAEVTGELGRVKALLDTDMGQVWSKLQDFIGSNKLGGPHSSLLEGRGFKLADPAKTTWKLVLDPQTGLSAWKRITEGGIPVKMPGVSPTTGAPTGTGAGAGSFFGDLKGGVGDIFGRIFDPKQIGSQVLGNLLSGGLSSILAGASGLLSGLFGSKGPSAAEQAYIDAMEKNSQALERVSQGLLNLGTSTVGARFGDVAEAINEGFRKAEEATTYDREGRPMGPSPIDLIEKEMARLGLTMADVRAVAEALGFDFSSLGRDASALQEALSHVSTFSRDFGLLQTKFDLFDITDPGQRFADVIDLLANSVGPDFAETLKNLTPENFGSFLEMFRAGFGGFDQSLLGNLPFEEFLKGLGFAENALDELGNTTAKATNALRNAPAGFKATADLLRHQAAEAVGLSSPHTRSTAVPGSAAGFTPAMVQALADAGVGSGITVHGDLVVQANDPDQMRRKIEEKVQWAQRTGGSSVLKIETVR